MCKSPDEDHDLDLNLDEVRNRSEDNEKTLYGVALVAGHPITGDAGKTIAAWRDEVSLITDGKVVVATGSSHSTIATICPSQPEKPNAECLDGIDLNAALESIRICGPYEMHFKQVKLISGGNGNILLVTQTKNNELGKLRRALQKANLRLNWEPPQEGQPAEAFVSLAHISSGALESLSPESVRELNDWIQLHSELDESVFFQVKEIKAVAYCRRRLDKVMAPDIVLPLGQECKMTGGMLREAILSAFAKDRCEDFHPLQV
jgi:hypothetical protein